MLNSAILLVEGVPSEALKMVSNSIRLTNRKVIQVTSNRDLTTSVADLFDHQIYCDTDNEDEVIENIQKLDLLIDGVGSTDGFSVLTTNSIAMRMGLNAFPHPALVVCCNKLLSRRILDTIDKNLNPSWEVSAFQSPLSAQDIQPLLDISSKVVVKPSSMCGGTLVSAHSSAKSAVNAINLIHGKDSTQSVLVEAYVEGEEYSVEVYDGDILGVSSVYTQEGYGFAETGQLFPYDANVNLVSQLKKKAQSILNHFDLLQGPAHLQFRVQNEEIKFIEINPRLPGGLVSGLIKHSIGVNLADYYLNSILGRRNETPSKIIEKQRYACGMFLMAEPNQSGVIKDWHGIEELRSNIGLYAVELVKIAGQYVKSDGSNADRLAYVIAGSDSSECAVTNASNSVQKILPVWK